MARGRVQVEWVGANQMRANNSRDWLNLQLQGRGYIAADIPHAVLRHGLWTTVADIGFDTVQEGNTVKALVEARQSADPFVLAGSWHQVHTCEDVNVLGGCAGSLVRVVK